MQRKTEAVPPDFPVPRYSANRDYVYSPSPPPRNSLEKFFIPRSVITIKIVNKYIHYTKIVVLKTVKSNSVI